MDREGWRRRRRKTVSERLRVRAGVIDLGNKENAGGGEVREEDCFQTRC